VRYLGIQDPGVRKEALNTIATLLGKSSEHYLLRLLGDKDPSIRVQALFHLVKIESNHSKFLDFLFKVLDRGVNLLSEAELIRILNAIREMKEIPRKQELESRVIRLLEGRTKGGLMGFIKRRKPLGSSSLLQAAGKLLIKIQSSYPEHILKESGSEKEDPKRLKIRKIFKELVLEERTN
jgi:HEAT repeat protein